MPFGEKERVIGAIAIRFGKLSFSVTNGRNNVSIELVTCVISFEEVSKRFFASAVIAWKVACLQIFSSQAGDQLGDGINATHASDPMAS